MAECLHTTHQLIRCTVPQNGQYNLRCYHCPSLVELCVYHFVNIPLDLMVYDFDKLSNPAVLNNTITQMIMHYLDNKTLEKLIKSGSFLSDSTKCKITELCLTKRPFEDIALKHMHCHNLSALYLSETDIGDDALHHISSTQPNLTHLDISYCLRIEVFEQIFRLTKLQYLDLTRTHFKLNIVNSCLLGRIPIKWLGLAQLQKHHTEDPLKLQHLMVCAGTLQVLNLSGTAWDIQNVESFLRFPDLEHLDVSFYPPHALSDVYYDAAINTFSVMPSLKSLDFSGCSFHEDECIMRLINLNLNFLGIVMPHLLLDNLDVLAKKVASNRKLEHLLVQLQRYINRPEMLETALKNLFHLHRERNQQGYDTSNINPLLFEAVLNVLEVYPKSRDIQMIAVACMHPLTNTQLTYNGIGLHIRRGILVFLKNLKNYSNFEVLRNTLSLLSNFNLREPEYMFYDIMRSLLDVLNSTRLYDKDINTQRNNRLLCKLNVKIINACICKASSHKKAVSGEMGLVESILNAAAEAFQLFLRVVDIEVILLLEECWSTLWNITDELPINCDRFIYNGGLEFYYQTYQHCSTVLETIEDGSSRITTIIRNMLGLMGNIAEVLHIRPRLITQDLIQSFLMLLSYDGEADNPSDIVEIRYSAAGILSHICSDGGIKWEISEPSFNQAIEGIEAAVSTWNLNSERTINYKSFHPILRLIKVDCAYQCKYWAMWALANLCQYQPHRFVAMLRRDGGEALIRELLLLHNEYPDNIKLLGIFLLEKIEDTNISDVIQSIDPNSEGDS